MARDSEKIKKYPYQKQRMHGTYLPFRLRAGLAKFHLIRNPVFFKENLSQTFI